MQIKNYWIWKEIVGKKKENEKEIENSHCIVKTANP